MTDAGIRPILSFLGKAGDRAGEDRFRLMAEIDRTGSIAAAAKAVGLSYKGAWDSVNALNNLFPRPMVVAQPGGKRGGGALVTAEGKRAVALHRLMTEKLGEALASFEAALSSDPSFASLSQSSLWRAPMKTSARNTYHGVITSVRHGAVNSEIVLRVSDEVELTAIVTEHSAAELAMAPGREAYALIKASTPILIKGENGVLTSARNRVCGEVISVEPGAVNAEIVLDIGAGKTLCAIITDDSARALDIEVGDRLCALIKASQIILAVN